MTAVVALHACLPDTHSAGVGATSMALVPAVIVLVAGLMCDHMCFDYPVLPGTDNSAAQTSVHLVDGHLYDLVSLSPHA